jgi:hypothetical protein
VAFFFISEKDAVDEGVGALRGFGGIGERFLAAMVDTVGEDDESFAALLLFHEFVGGEVNRVVEKRAPAVAMAVRTAAVSTSTAAARTGLGVLRRVDLVDGREEFLAGRGEVLKEFDFAIEMDEESLIFIFAQDAIEERVAGGAFLIEDAALAEAGINEEAEGEREVGLLGEVGDGLGLAVLFESEVVFGEIADEVAVFVADGGEEIDGGDVDGDGRGLLAEEGKCCEEKGCEEKGCEEKGGEEKGGEVKSEGSQKIQEGGKISARARRKRFFRCMFRCVLRINTHEMTTVGEPFVERQQTQVYWVCR